MANDCYAYPSFYREGRISKHGVGNTFSDPLNPRCNLLDCFSESDKRVSVAGMRCNDSQY